MNEKNKWIESRVNFLERTLANKMGFIFRKDRKKHAVQTHAKRTACG